MSQAHAVDFVKQVNVLASVMSEPKWGEMNIPDAKPIGISQWRTSIALAALVARECPDAGWPVPGADPDGFVWLTWSNGLRSRQIQLEIHEGAHQAPYKWTQLREGSKTFYESRALRDLVESIRTTFGKPT